MEVYLIRHTTPLIQKGLIYGRLEVGLADTFESEKKLILQKLSGNLDLVYSSPSVRCFELAKALCSNCILDERLLEYNFGDWEGKRWDTNQSKEVDNWMSDYVNVCPPNGETLLEMQSRVLEFWNDLLTQPGGENRVGIVTHGGVIRIIMAYIDQPDLEKIFNIKINYGEVVVFKDGRVKVINI
jgi:alpha-ribazole phosphatase